MADTIKVAIIDDHPLFVSGVKKGLEGAPDIELIAEGGSAQDALAIAGSMDLDVMLMDISLPGGGIDAVRRLRELVPATRVVMLTASTAERDVFDALEEGASGYVVKDDGAYELRSAIRSIVRGQPYVSSALAVHILTRADVKPHGDGRNPKDPSELSEQEIAILAAASRGRSNREIATELQLSPQTVKNYMSRILQKMNVRNRIQAVNQFLGA